MTFPAFTAILDRRLRPAAAAPLAVGFSGGGDSLALLILTLDWARAHGRAVVALTVDHQLNPASAAWTADAVAKARALGADAQALAWTGDKPFTGRPPRPAGRRRPRRRSPRPAAGPHRRRPGRGRRHADGGLHRVGPPRMVAVAGLAAGAGCVRAAALAGPGAGRASRLAGGAWPDLAGRSGQ